MGTHVAPSIASTGSGANSASGGVTGGTTGNLATSAAPPPATVHGFDVRELGYALPGEIPGSGMFLRFLVVTEIQEWKN